MSYLLTQVKKVNLGAATVVVVVVVVVVWGCCALPNGKKRISLAFAGALLMAALNRWTDPDGVGVVVVVVVVAAAAAIFWQNWVSSSAPLGQFLMPSQTKVGLMHPDEPVEKIQSIIIRFKSLQCWNDGLIKLQTVQLWFFNKLIKKF